MAVKGEPVGQRWMSVAAGLAGSRVLGELPSAVHPVALFGRLMTAVEAALCTPRRAAGVAYALAGVAVGVIGGATARRAAPAVTLAAAGRQLREAALKVDGALAGDNLDAARSLLPALVGRDPSELDEREVAAAVIESLGENTVDAVVAPAWWALIGGPVGAATYRAVNTMDAMVGHRSARYEHFGWCSARLDDAANFLPARLTAALVAGVRPGAAGAIARAVREDAPAHPSPNAGVAEAAFAAALGVELGGRLRYGERVEHRPALGRGPRPGRADIGRAVRLCGDVELALLGGLIAMGSAARTWRERRR